MKKKKDKGNLCPYVLSSWREPSVINSLKSINGNILDWEKWPVCIWGRLRGSISRINQEKISDCIKVRVTWCEASTCGLEIRQDVWLLRSDMFIARLYCHSESSGGQHWSGSSVCSWGSKSVIYAAISWCK